MSKKKKNVKKAAPVATPKVSTSNFYFWANRKLQTIILFAVAFLFYANTLNHGYTQDDSIVITENMYTTDGLSGIPGILSKDTFYGFFKTEGKSKLVSGGRYRPLTLVMFATGYQFFGESPFVGHLMNVLWFCVTCLMLYWLLLKLFRFEKEPEYAGMIAFCTTLLFAAHPIHTEVVANIKGRDEIITLLGSLAALYFSIRAYREKDTKLNIIGAIIFFLALFSKENAITFLAIIPITFWVFTKADLGTIIKQTIPFVIAAVGFLVVRGSILGWSLGEPPLELMNNPFVKIEGGRYVPFSAGEQFATIFHTLGHYVKLLFVPHPLTHDYYPRHIEMKSFEDISVIISLVGYVAALAWSLLATFQRKPVGYAVLFYLITLSVVSNLAFPVGTNMAERLIFMPSVGFCLLFVLGISELFGKLTESRVSKNMLLTVIGLSLIYGAGTFVRNQAWKDNFTLFTTDIKTSKNSAKLRNAVAGELLNKYGNAPANQRDEASLTVAANHLKEAIKIHPNYKNAYLLLGNAHNYLKKYEESIQYYNKALQFDGGYKEAQNNLGLTYRDAGKYYGETAQDFKKSIEYLNKALQMRPDDPEVIRLLGIANGAAGNHPKAIELLTKFTQLKPENALGFLALGTSFLNAGRAAEAVAVLTKANQLKPNDPNVLRMIEIAKNNKPNQ